MLGGARSAPLGLMPVLLVKFHLEVCVAFVLKCAVVIRCSGFNSH